MRTLIAFAAVVATMALPAAASAAPPKAVTGPAIEIADTTATLTGVINPNGKGTIFTFDYGTTTRYGERVEESQEIFGNQDLEISSPLEGLTPGTTYHYRLTARNGDGSTTASDGTFQTTGEAPPAPVNRMTLSATPRLVTHGFHTVLQGQLSGPGNRNVKVTLQQNPYRFKTFVNSTRSTTTDNNGIFTFRVFPTVLTRYRAFAEASVPLVSDFIEVDVRYGTTIKSSARTVARGGRVTISGTVSPDHDGHKVHLQRRAPGGYKTIATMRLKGTSGERSVFRFKTRVRSTAQYRVQIPTDVGHAANNTKSVRVRVR